MKGSDIGFGELNRMLNENAAYAVKSMAAKQLIRHDFNYLLVILIMHVFPPPIVNLSFDKRFTKFSRHSYSLS